MNYKFKIGDSKVLESREALDGTMIRRRRVTSDGKHRFTTYERIDLVPLMVVKKDQTREAFDVEKLRRGIAKACEKRPVSFTTYERIEMPQLMVKKRCGDREVFDRDKLATSIRRSVGKFLNSELEVEEVIERAMDILYSYGQETVTSEQIGEAVLEVLSEMNEVAYIRYTSVFRKFKTLDEFEEIIRKQRERTANKPEVA